MWVLTPGFTVRELPVKLSNINNLTRGFKNLNLLDEPYWPMICDTNRIEVLATADVEEEPRPLVWTFERGKGRVFASIIGHYDWSFNDPLFRILALRGVASAVGEPAWRFDNLSP